VLLPALALGGMLDVAGIHLFGESGIYGGHTGAHEAGFAIRSHLSVPIMLGNYVFLQGIYVPTLGSNGPLWSLSYEFWYYIAFPFLAGALFPGISIRKRVLNGALLVAVVVFMRPPIAVLGLTWLMGVAIHYLPQLPANSSLVRRSLTIMALVACGGVLVWCKQIGNPLTDYVLGLAVTALIYVVLSCSRTPMPEAYNRTAHVLSGSSYTLYLVHVPLLIFIAAWMGMERQVPDARSLLTGCGIFAATMLYAQVVWFFFERRTDAIRARIRPWVMRSATKSTETAAPA
jgi:peptidoglycan/LPS O-acetylase OafA/YrhL